jgi:hypothetical protein
MPAMTFTAQELSDLGVKLDEVIAGFDDRERALLAGVISLASEALESRHQDEVVGFASPSPHDFVITKQLDMASPTLFQTALAGPSGPQESLTLNFTKIIYT